MNIFHDLNNLPDFKNAVIATGSFDGVHAGHQKIFARINELAEQYNGESVVVTFDPHPRQIIYPKDHTLRLLTSTPEKVKYFEKYGIDNVVILPFTIEFSQQHAREYVEKFLIEKFKPRCLVVGYDHRFGLNREGTYDLLKEYADRDFFDLVKIDKQEVRDITVSSTKIRDAVSRGDIEVANELLGHPYNICGTVVHGQKLGKQLGFPTANIQLDNPLKLLPPEGIYAVHAYVNNEMLGGMLYIGKRPTVSRLQSGLSIEVNLFDFQEDIYDAPIELDLLSFVRGDQEMPDLAELSKAIANDERMVRQVLERYRKADTSVRKDLTTVVQSSGRSGHGNKDIPTEQTDISNSTKSVGTTAEVDDNTRSCKTHDSGEIHSSETISPNDENELSDTKDVAGKEDISETKGNVAIVALNYNGSRVLPIYLPSFDKHAGSADIYIADNGSTDDSVAFVKDHFRSMRIIRLSKNYGYAGGYNKALENVDYKYLALINTDIELTEGWLQPMLEILESNPKIAAVQPKILAAKNRDTFEYAGACGGYIDRLGYPFCAGRILSDVEKDSGQYDEPASIFWASGAAFVIRSDVFHALGGFDADYFAHMEEIDLCWRIHRAGFDIVYTPQSVVFHEGGATLPYNSPQKVFLNFRNNLATLIKNLPVHKLLLVIPLRMALDTLAGVHFIAQGKFANCGAIIRAYFALIMWLPSLVKKRRLAEKQIAALSVGPADNHGWYRGSILWQYYVGGKKTFSALKSRWYEGA